MESDIVQTMMNNLHAMKKEMERLRWLKGVEEEWPEEEHDESQLREYEIVAAAQQGGYALGEKGVEAGGAGNRNVGGRTAGLP